ncbi:MAG: KH domain-containing protein [Cyanobacteria bacterium J06559_3]
MAEKPDYAGLLRFLMTPFLDSPEELKIDVEQLNGQDNVWLRVAFSSEDRGRMFGRGGRNIQAIRTALKATATLHGQKAALDVYGESMSQGRSGTEERNGSGGGDHRQRRGRSRPSRRQ